MNRHQEAKAVLAYLNDALEHWDFCKPNQAVREIKEKLKTVDASNVAFYMNDLGPSLADYLAEVENNSKDKAKEELEKLDKAISGLSRAHSEQISSHDKQLHALRCQVESLETRYSELQGQIQRNEDEIWESLRSLWKNHSGLWDSFTQLENRIERKLKAKCRKP